MCHLLLVKKPAQVWFLYGTEAGEVRLRRVKTSLTKQVLVANEDSELLPQVDTLNQILS